METGLIRKLLADEHVEGPLSRGLLRLAIDIVTVQECGLAGTEDEDLLAFATAEGRIMLTNDQDFLAIHANWITASRSHGGIIYWHQTKYSVGNAIRRIVAALEFPAIDPIGNLIYL